jgi:hypothetical protein
MDASRLAAEVGEMSDERISRAFSAAVNLGQIGPMLRATLPPRDEYDFVRASAYVQQAQEQLDVVRGYLAEAQESFRDGAVVELLK